MMDKSEKAAFERSSERRQRENEASRLATEIPGLTRLKMAVVETRGLGASKYTRVIVVASAPALFVLPCGDHNCKDGGYDLTTSALYALRAGQRTFATHDSCGGMVGSAPCRRSIDVTFSAEYAGG